MVSCSTESEVLRRFYSDVQEVIAHPRSAASLLYQEGVISEEVLNTEPSSEKNAAIIRAVSAAVKADPKKLLVLIAVLNRFAESAPVASRMRDALRSHWLGESSRECTPEDSFYNQRSQALGYRNDCICLKCFHNR